jgi:hypothetical protein
MSLNRGKNRIRRNQPAARNRGAFRRCRYGCPRSGSSLPLSRKVKTCLGSRAMHAISLDHGNRILRVEVRAEAEGEPFSPRLASMTIAAGLLDSQEQSRRSVDTARLALEARERHLCEAHTGRRRSICLARPVGPRVAAPAHCVFRSAYTSPRRFEAVHKIFPNIERNILSTTRLSLLLIGDRSKAADGRGRLCGSH